MLHVGQHPQEASGSAATVAQVAPTSCGQSKTDVSIMKDVSVKKDKKPKKDKTTKKEKKDQKKVKDKCRP